MKLLSTAQIPSHRARRNWRPETARLTLRGWPTSVEVVIDTKRTTWTRTVTVASIDELHAALAADVDRLADSLWGDA